MEVFLQAMGFAPTRPAEEKEKYWMVQENTRFYELQRRSLLDLWDYTRRTKDREGLSVVRKAVLDFNATVPFGNMKITSDNIKASLTGRIRERKMIEAGVLNGKRGLPIQRDVEKAFPVPDVEEEVLR